MEFLAGLLVGIALIFVAGGHVPVWWALLGLAYLVVSFIVTKGWRV
jgi:hypothetical protein